jgi:Na+-driven multidrug efflux pump
MGVHGAALATVISQIVTVIYLVYYFFTGKSSLKIRVGDLRLDRSIILESSAIGSASFFRQISSSILIIIMNNTLKVYGGGLSIAAYGIIHRLLMFVSMLIFGIAQGLQPIIGFNYGAKRFDKVRQSLTLAIRAATIMGLCGTLILIIFTRPLLTIFTNNRELLDIGSNALRIYVLAFPLFGFQVIGSTLFQALGKAKQALGLTVGKQLFVVIMVLILPRLFQLNGVWLTFPITDVVFFFVTLAFYLPQMRELDTKMAKV